MIKIQQGFVSQKRVIQFDTSGLKDLPCEINKYILGYIPSKLRCNSMIKDKWEEIINGLRGFRVINLKNLVAEMRGYVRNKILKKQKEECDGVPGEIRYDLIAAYFSYSFYSFFNILSFFSTRFIVSFLSFQNFL